MNKFTRIAVGAFAVAAVIAPVGSATATAPAARSWTTVESMNGTRQHACKVLVNEGTAWRIYNRLDARRATAPRMRATMTALRGGTRIASRSWQSGWVATGNLSDVGTFKIPRARGWSLEMSIQADEAGDGGLLTVSAVGRC